MKVLITGGAGFIGSHLAAHYCGLGAEVVVLDSLRSGHLHNLAGLPVRMVRGSVTDRSLVARAAQGAHCIFHLAAMISVPESIERPGECVEINVQGTLNVLEAARLHRVGKVVLSSSAAIYGNGPELPKREDMRPEPQSPYGVTKLDGEYYLELYRRQHGLNTASLRYFNVYGPRQDPASPYAAAVPNFIARALRGESLTVFGDGLQTRDFVHVADVVAANRWVANSPAAQGVFNVARGTSMTVLELAERILSLTRSDSALVHLMERPGDVRHSRADSQRLQSLGFEFKTDLETGLADTVDFYRNQFAAV